MFMADEINEHGTAHEHAPAIASDAVLKPSDPISEGAREIRGINFDDFREREMTVKDMVSGMANMGFQASAVADAVRIINNMVGARTPNRLYQTYACRARELGQIQKPTPKQPYS